MRKAIKVITDDGHQFDSVAEARKYLDDLYHLQLTGLAHQLVSLEKYTRTVEFLETHTEELADMLEIKAELDRPVKELEG